MYRHWTWGCKSKNEWWRLDPWGAHCLVRKGVLQKWGKCDECHKELCIQWVESADDGLTRSESRWWGQASWGRQLFEGRMVTWLGFPRWSRGRASWAERRASTGLGGGKGRPAQVLSGNWRVWNRAPVQGDKLELSLQRWLVSRSISCHIFLALIQ